MRFDNMNFSDGHYVQIPISWDAQEFTHRFLSATPPWVRAIMRVRNRVVQKIGLQYSPHRNLSNWKLRLVHQRVLLPLLRSLMSMSSVAIRIGI